MYYPLPIHQRQAIYLRAWALLQPHNMFFARHGIKEFLIAGNSLNPIPAKPNDLDLFPMFGQTWPESLRRENPSHIVGDTPHAFTINVWPDVIQFCTYNVDNGVPAFLRTFDFAHVQVGVHIQNVNAFTAGEMPDLDYAKLYYTEKFAAARRENETWYCPETDSFPLCSLSRLIKYARYSEKGAPRMREITTQMLLILNAIIERGIVDDEDLRLQAKAISESIQNEELLRVLARHLGGQISDNWTFDGNDIPF